MINLMRAIPISFAFLIFPIVSQSQTARVLPTFDESLAKPLLVVADISPGAYFAVSAKCKQPDVVCIDPPPFSLKATVTFSVYGGNVQHKLELITGSHYGIGEYEEGLSTVLVMIKTDGKSFIMPRYAKKRLIRSKKNDLYILIFSSDPISWLPCSVSDLKEEIFSDEFDSLIEIQKTKFPALALKDFLNISAALQQVPRLDMRSPFQNLARILTI